MEIIIFLYPAGFFREAVIAISIDRKSNHQGGH